MASSGIIAELVHAQAACQIDRLVAVLQTFKMTSFALSAGLPCPRGCVPRSIHSRPHSPDTEAKILVLRMMLGAALLMTLLVLFGGMGGI